MDDIHIPIEDEIDLHTFRPVDVPGVLQEYIRACIQADIFTVRVIHGKGSGRLKRRVSHCLTRHPNVVSARDADAGSGGWGATIVELQK